MNYATHGCISTRISHRYVYKQQTGVFHMLLLPQTQLHAGLTSSYVHMQPSEHYSELYDAI